MFGSLLKAKSATPKSPAPASEPTASARPTRLTIAIHLANAPLTLTCGTRPDVVAEGHAALTQEADKIVIRERKNARESRPGCRVEVPRGAFVEVVSEFGGLTVFNFHGTLRARLKYGNAGVNHSDGQIRVVSGTGSVELESMRGTLDVLTSSGNITARQIDAEVQAVSDSGRILLEQVNGPLVARSTNGSITVRELRATARLTARTGAISVLGAERQLTVRTQSGDIMVEASIVDHTTLESHKGSIELRLGRHTDARIEAFARQGVVRAERLTLAAGSGRRTAKSVLGEGRARLRAETGVGVIELSGPRSVVL